MFGMFAYVYVYAIYLANAKCEQKKNGISNLIVFFFLNDDERFKKQNNNNKNMKQEK